MNTPSHFSPNMNMTPAPRNVAQGSWGNQISVPESVIQNQMSGGMVPGTMQPSSMGTVPRQGALPGTGPQDQMTQSFEEFMQEMPETLTNPVYTPGFLATQIGKIMRVEFLIGNILNDRVGRLVRVGASYIILEAITPGSYILCDIFSIKFVTIVSDEQGLLYSFG